MMWKVVLLGCLVGMAVAQLDMRRMMMMQMMQQSMGGSSGGAAGAAGSASNGMSSMLLCRNTDNLRFVPCANWKEICDMISMQTYNMPSLLTCSALGTGCCIKDIATMMMVSNMAK